MAAIGADKKESGAYRILYQGVLMHSLGNGHQQTQDSIYRSKAIRIPCGTIPVGFPGQFPGGVEPAKKDTMKTKLPPLVGFLTLTNTIVNAQTYTWEDKANGQVAADCNGPGRRILLA